jgi:phosphoglycerate dehydrogenase-like enzyme
MAKTPIVVTHQADGPIRALYAELLGERADIVYASDLVDAARAQALAAAEILVALNLRTELAAEEYAALDRLRFVQLLTAGVDHAPFSRLPAGVPVAGNPGAFALSMAEHVVTMILAAAKRLLVEHHAMQAGQFNQRNLNRRITGSTCAILGFGATGRETARLLRAMGVRVHGVNRSGRTDAPVDGMATPDTLEPTLRAADFVVIALPLTRVTEGFIGARELAWMKDDAILVNISRGEVIDQLALYDHLLAHPNFTACLDAWWVEPVRHGEFRIERPFLDLANVIGSPHNSASVPDAYLDAVRQAGANIGRVLDDGAPNGVVGEEEKLV